MGPTDSTPPDNIYTNNWHSRRVDDNRKTLESQQKTYVKSPSEKYSAIINSLGEIIKHTNSLEKNNITNLKDVHAYNQGAVKKLNASISSFLQTNNTGLTLSEGLLVNKMTTTVTTLKNEIQNVKANAKGNARKADPKVRETAKKKARRWRIRKVLSFVAAALGGLGFLGAYTASLVLGIATGALAPIVLGLVIGLMIGGLVIGIGGIILGAFADNQEGKAKSSIRLR